MEQAVVDVSNHWGVVWGMAVEESVSIGLTSQSSGLAVF